QAVKFPACRPGSHRAATHTIPALPTPPPRRFAPPRLDEEGRESGNVALLVEEGGTRQCRGRVVETDPKPHHPGAARHPSSTRRGACFLCLPSSWRRAGRDGVADGWSRPVQNHTTPALRATPPRERRGVALILPSSWRRAGRDNVADGWSRPIQNHTTPALRATPPRERRGV